MSISSIPYILRHCTVAVYGRKDTKGEGLEKFKNAWMIARWALTQQGYLATGSEDGPVERIKLTGKGRQREGKHRNEGAWKNRLFEEMYEKLEAHGKKDAAADPSDKQTSDGTPPKPDDERRRAAEPQPKTKPKKSVKLAPKPHPLPPKKRDLTPKARKLRPKRRTLVKKARRATGARRTPKARHK